MTSSKTPTKTTEATEVPTPETPTPEAETTPILSPAMLEAHRIQTAPGWRPTAGDTIEGKIVDLAVRKLRPIGDQPARNILVLTLDTGDTEHYTSVFVMHSVLQAALDNIRPSKGDRLSILYNGKVPSDKDPDTQYHSYTVTAPDAAAVPFNWDRLN